MRIILVGFGTVGRAVAGILESNRARLLGEHGINPRIVGIATSKGAAVSESGLGSDTRIEANGLAAERIIEDCAADVVIEAAPTVLSDPRPAIERLKTAFRTGKHAVCVNKAPLAVALPALRELAEYNGVQFRFSGTVGGGTPVLDWGRSCAQADEVVEVRAILNGTTNYILTRMHDDGASFEQALTEAQQKGYAEADPSGDVDGIDPAIKLVIFANWVLARRVSIQDVRVRGIRGCDEAVREARAAGKKLKLVGRIAEGLTLEPTAVDVDSPLAVSGTLNAVSMTLRASGTVTLIGRGAGGPETATSVVRDLIALWHEAWEKRRFYVEPR